MLGELIDLVSGIATGAPGDKAKDILGRVYEYFLGGFAGSTGRFKFSIMKVTPCSAPRSAMRESVSRAFSHIAPVTTSSRPGTFQHAKVVRLPVPDAGLEAEFGQATQAPLHGFVPPTFRRRQKA